MVKKLPIRFRMKKVIEALREGKKTWSQLAKLGVPEKTLERILKDYLLYWGLVRKEGDYYVWFEHSRTFKSKHDYDLAIEHSRKLIPAFKSMLNIAELDRPQLYFAAKEHLLSGYPEIYEKLQKFEEMFNERIRYLFAKHKHRIKIGGRDFWMLQPIEVKKKGVLGKLGFTDVELKKINIPYAIAIPEKNYEEFKKTEEYKEIMELREFLDNTKAFNERFKLYREFAGEISLLILKIEMGEPLEGKCSLCPKIKITEQSKL